MKSIVIVVSLCLFGSDPLGAQPQRFTAIPLGGLSSGGALAYGVNDYGQVCGTSLDASGAFRAFVWENGEMSDLGSLPGYDWADAYSINNSGVIVGRSETTQGFNRATLWRRGPDGQWLAEDLGSLGGETSIAYRINERGDVTGESSNSAGVSHAFLYRDGEMIDLGTLALSWSTFARGYGINDAAECVGVVYTPGGAVLRGFFYTGDAQIDLTPREPLGVAECQAINNARVIAGTVSAPGLTGDASRAAIYEPGSGWRLLPKLPGLPQTGAYDINAAGDVVGIAYTPGPPFAEFRGVVFSGAQVEDLNVLTRGLSGLVTEAWDISDNGYIAANVDGLTTFTAVLLRPDVLRCPGDLTFDRQIDEADMGVLLQAWRTNAGGDLDGDGDTDEGDLGQLLQNWGARARERGAVGRL